MSVMGATADLEGIVLIDLEQRSVEVFRKNASGVWELHPSDERQPEVGLHTIDWRGTAYDLIGE